VTGDALAGASAAARRADADRFSDAKAQGVTHLRWSNAGHPPPMTATSDGQGDVLAGDDADLLLGIDPSSPRAESLVTLSRDSTVLLYTDGLVERRGQNLDEGLERLRDALRELASLPLNELCDELLARLLPSSSDDDVALVAVRLHRQDEPRPAEAGPELVPPEVPPP
jgi:serine phosphatase RsbU (regulator of sigma subunit)